jgi:hypothetical protein
MRDRKQLAPEAPGGASASKRGKPAAGLTPEIQAKIGQQLRAYYAGLIEPVPDRFAALMRQLDKESGKEPPE